MAERKILDRRAQFINQRNHVFTPASPINSPEHLRGRHAALARVTDALTAPGRHAFIYGFRGVGKTSLAQTAAFQLQSSHTSPILVTCDESTTFNQVCTQLVRKVNTGLRLTRDSKIKLGISAAGYGGVNLEKETKSSAPELAVQSVADALDKLENFFAHSDVPRFAVIDEFDRISDEAERNKFASLVKALSDQGLPLRLLFCGVSDSIEGLLSAHQSIGRQVHAERVERLKLGDCISIVEDGSKELEIFFPPSFRYRIAQMSDGFPSFVHLLGEKIITRAFDAEETIVSSDSYTNGLDDAIESVAPMLKQAYENSLYKNKRRAEDVVWSIAGDDLLDVSTEDVWRNYQGIASQKGIPITEMYTRNNVAVKLNQLCSDAHGRLIFKPRRNYFSFSEKMMRGYARMRAAQSNVTLGPENSSVKGKSA